MLDQNTLLSKAILIATNAHDGQFDKGGNPYILHPLHLMHQMMFDKELAMIAVMHDVVEDSDITIDDLYSEGFSERVVSAIELLTKVEGQSNDEYIEGICTNLDAIRVKRKDIDHNLQVSRLKGLREKDFLRVEKYHRNFVKLGEAKRALIDSQELGLSPINDEYFIEDIEEFHRAG